MDQDELAQDDFQDSKSQVADISEESTNSDPLLPSDQEDELDLGILEPPLPIEETFSEPSKLRLFLRRLIRWLVAVLIIFALGVAATWLTRVAPQQKEIENLERDLETIQQEADLSASEVEDLLPLVDENEDLISDIATMEMHIELLKIQADVASAHLALLAEDIVTARASLAGTDNRLDLLMRDLDGEDRNTVQGMLTRLELVLEELGEDTFAAIRDLEVLGSNLAALERSVFGN